MLLQQTASSHRPPAGLRSMLGPLAGVLVQAAVDAPQRQLAQRLVSQRYAQRGYRRVLRCGEADARLLTLSANEGDHVQGTLGIRFDSPAGLNADAFFPAEMAELRASGRLICEFTQLALDHDVSSREVLAALFHTAHLHAHRLRGIELLVIEVNPRHVPYYRRMLGFKVCGAERMNPRVQAPAVLMVLDLNYCQQQIDLYGGRPELGEQVRSLYPYAFSAEEVQRLLSELREQMCLVNATSGPPAIAGAALSQ